MIAGHREPLVLSPMVDVTDAAFRSIASEWGADITCSEMVSSAGIVHGNQSTWDLVQPWPDGESPYGVQLMGGDPEVMAQAVAKVADRIQPDFIDLNLGCPSPNILRSCAGGFLLRDPKQAGRVIGAAVDAAGSVPVSVKMRMGHDHDHLTYREVGQEAESAGAQWCTLHGRTVTQMYSGQADWDAIANLVEAVDIPVIGNGDLRAPDDVLAMRERTHCAGYFIARAAMKDPTIFRPMRAALNGEDAPDEPGLDERLAVFGTYLERRARLGPPHIADLRRQATRFISGVAGAKQIRQALHTAGTVAEIEAAMGITRSRGA